MATNVKAVPVGKTMVNAVAKDIRLGVKVVTSDMFSAFWRLTNDLGITSGDAKAKIRPLSLDAEMLKTYGGEDFHHQNIVKYKSTENILHEVNLQESNLNILPVKNKCINRDHSDLSGSTINKEFYHDSKLINVNSSLKSQSSKLQCAVSKSDSREKNYDRNVIIFVMEIEYLFLQNC